MTKRKTYHVTPNTDGGWKVKEEKASGLRVITKRKRRRSSEQRSWRRTRASDKS
jgi:hypothetical protein